MAFSMGNLPELTRERVVENSVSKPRLPGFAWAKGSNLLSLFWGEWSELIASIIPFFSDCSTNFLSSSDLKGGDNLYLVS